MRKFIYLFILVGLLCSNLQEVSVQTGFVPLGKVKVGDSLVSNLWGVTHLTCKSDFIILNNQRVSKVYFWVDSFSRNEISVSTLVSRDTKCVETATEQGGKFNDLYWKLKYRFIMTWGSALPDPHRDLMSARQESTLNSDTPGLWCKAIEIGMYGDGKNKPPRYEKVVFSPFKYYSNFFTSRDLTCTTDLKKIDRWRKQPGWKVVDL